MSDLRQLLIDVWVGVEQNVIDSDVVHWLRCLHACIRAVVTQSSQNVVNYNKTSATA